MDSGAPWHTAAGGTQVDDRDPHGTRPLGYEVNDTVPHLIGSRAVPSAQADRPWRLTSSSLFGRCPQRPHYRFYYGGPRIVVDTMLAVPSPWVPVVTFRRGWIWLIALVDLGDLFSSPG